MKHIKFLLHILIIASSVGRFQGLAKAQSTQDIIDDINGQISGINQEFNNVMRNANARETQRRNNFPNFCWQEYDWVCDEYNRAMKRREPTYRMASLRRTATLEL